MKANEFLGSASSDFLKKDDFPAPRPMQIIRTAKGEYDDEAYLFVEIQQVDDGPPLRGNVRLNQTNLRVLVEVLGDETQNWDGSVLVFYNDPSVTFQGKPIGGIRVRALSALEQKAMEGGASVAPPTQTSTLQMPGM